MAAAAAPATMPEITLPDYAYTPQLGWSSTRSETFRTCRRRYFFQYYGRYDTEIAQAQIQRLKSLSSVAMSVGEAVHVVLATLLKRLLRSTDPIDQERFRRHVQETIANLIASTEFMEVYYRQRTVPELEELLAPVMGCLEQVMTSERYGWLQEVLRGDPNHLIEPPGYGEARLQGMKIYAKVDCLFEVDGEAVILDWKTGRQDPAQHLRQLLGYAAWAEDHLNCRPSGSAAWRPTCSRLTKRSRSGPRRAICRDWRRRWPLRSSRWRACAATPSATSHWRRKRSRSRRTPATAATASSVNSVAAWRPLRRGEQQQPARNAGSSAPRRPVSG
jgi:hypothetical protein